MAGSWQDQYARMLRSHRRVKEALSKRVDPGDPDYPPLDAFYHFCCDALHLRDWIADDIPAKASAAVAAIKADVALSVCSDVANGGKHRVATRTVLNPDGVPSVAERVSVTVRVSPMRAYVGSGPVPEPTEPEEVGSVQVDAG